LKHKRLRILGTRGIPAAHGGFETFAERLALYLVERGWEVTVYCHVSNALPTPPDDDWCGIYRVYIGVADNPVGTVRFDWLCISHAIRYGPEDICLTLGYNTAIFTARLLERGIRNLINMDGIEWRRSKYGPLARTWLYLNDWAGCLLGDHLIADHPEIARHLLTRTSEDKISTIAYGADPPQRSVEAPDLVEGPYACVIARAEPENSLLEIVQAFSKCERPLKLVVLGAYYDNNAYQVKVRAAASDQVVFAGAIYERPAVQRLRDGAVLYVHGHQVGGTNPSLVEAMAASNPVLAHDNPFNRWVAGDHSAFFRNADECADQMTDLFDDPLRLAQMGQASHARFLARFTWPTVLERYEKVLNDQIRA
jgi:glycosyltransferase involved in cell wall biosynthesis